MPDLRVDDRLVGPVEIATTRRSRSRGLLGREGITGAMWLSPCRHVHSFRMRFDLDIAHVDKHGCVIAVHRLPRNRLGAWHWKTHSILEAEPGTFERWGLKPGSSVSAPSA